MSAAYREAAGVLQLVLSKKRGLRSAALASHIKNKRKVWVTMRFVCTGLNVNMRMTSHGCKGCYVLGQECFLSSFCRLQLSSIIMHYSHLCRTLNQVFRN